MSNIALFVDARTHPAARNRWTAGSRAVLITTTMAAAITLIAACGASSNNSTAQQAALVMQGQQIFRFDTFGDEAKWTDTLRMHEVISATAVTMRLDEPHF